MEKKSKKTVMAEGTRRLTPEQARYIASFGAAMMSVERAQRASKKYAKEYKELVRMRMWDADYLAHAYVLVVGKLSPLSSRLRSYILALGYLARQIFDSQEDNGKEDSSAE